MLFMLRCAAILHNQKNVKQSHKKLLLVLTFYGFGSGSVAIPVRYRLLTLSHHSKLQIEMQL